MASDGTLLSQLSFAALGSRCGSAWQDQPLAAEWTTITATPRRGFTGHEHLDNLSLVQLNGRVYDPKLGRFLSADPVYLDDLASPQTLNPYSYASNNPLTCTDPSGYSAGSAAADSFFASTALMQMINQDLSAREQQRDLALEQARRDFESFRNEGPPRNRVCPSRPWPG